jgi:hypothetical protein
MEWMLCQVVGIGWTSRRVLNALRLARRRVLSVNQQDMMFLLLAWLRLFLVVGHGTMSPVVNVVKHQKRIATWQASVRSTGLLVV